jgi:hypothetical protein
MIFILNYVFTVMLYATRGTKQDPTYICFDFKKINLICSIFAIHFKFHFHRPVLYDKMNKTISHLHMFVPCHQQCFSHQMYSSNQISNVHFLLDLFPSFDWTPT